VILPRPRATDSQCDVMEQEPQSAAQLISFV